MMTAIKVMIPKTLAIAEAAAMAIIIAPPRIVGVSPNRATVAAEMMRGPIDGSAGPPVAAISHAARSHVGTIVMYRDSAAPLKACATAAVHDVTASTPAEFTSVKSASAALRNVNVAATAAKAAASAAQPTSTAGSTTAAATCFGN